MRHSFKNILVRNKLEEKVKDAIRASGLPIEYESESLQYIVPASEHSYTPDFKISDNVYIEAKGIWDISDRKKILLIMDQYPDVIICMAFHNAQYKIGSHVNSTTYADWCDKHLIPWIDTRFETIPKEWCNDVVI